MTRYVSTTVIAHVMTTYKLNIKVCLYLIKHHAIMTWRHRGVEV